MPSFILLIVVLVVIEGVINARVLFFIGTNVMVLVYIIMKMVIYPLFSKNKKIMDLLYKYIHSKKCLSCVLYILIAYLMI